MITDCGPAQPRSTLARSDSSSFFHAWAFFQLAGAGLCTLAGIGAATSLATTEAAALGACITRATFEVLVLVTVRSARVTLPCF